MQTGRNVLKWVIAIISGAIGGFFGLFGGPVGAFVGVISGLLVGYYYVHFTLKIRSRYVLLRIILGTLNGTLAGLISGISVHIPSLFIQQKHGLFGGDGGAISTGAVFGLAIGTVFGFIGACIIASIPREKESE
jgi:hypothetical protein